MTKLQDSTFKEKASRVKDVSKILPEIGAVVLNEYDGRLYAADEYGWHKFGEAYSPITLFIDFDGTNQFNFAFNAPGTSTLIIADGDGTITEVPGGVDQIDHITNYTEAGLYYFTVTGDVNDITVINLHNVGEMVSGSINQFKLIPGLTNMSITGCPNFYGSIDGFLSDVFASLLTNNNLNITGNLESFEGFEMNDFTTISPLVKGDVSRVGIGDFIQLFVVNGTDSSFDRIVPMTITLQFRAQGCGWSSRSVDNCLISLADGTTTGATIYLDGNQRRTVRSDAAYDQLIAAGCTINF